MNKLLTVIIVIGLPACGQTKIKGETKTMDFGSFSIEAPQSWTAINENSVDSYAGRIAIDSTDTLSFDLGWYSNRLYEYDPIIFDSSMMANIDTSMTDTNEIIFVKNRTQVDPDKYRKNNVLWDTIDGRKAKIVYPRQTGIGTTGIYIDSLWVKGSDIDRFNLYGKNLKPENERKVVNVIRTLKFRTK
jgi:hypothetical protein